MAESCNAMSKECVTWALFNYKLQKKKKKEEEEEEEEEEEDRKLYTICPDALYVSVV